MSTPFLLPKWLAKPNNLEGEVRLQIVAGKGVYVTVTRLDTGEAIELPEEGNGEPDSITRIVRQARDNRRGYVRDRVDAALQDEWQRERLGLKT